MLDFSKVKFYLLSEKYHNDKHCPLAAAVMLVITGGEGLFRPGDVMKHMTMLIQEGKTLSTGDGVSVEIGRWGDRYLAELDPNPISDDMYFAWVDPGFFDYEPNLVFYTKTDFMELFADCCRNYVESEKTSVMDVSENGVWRKVPNGRDRTEEFAAAMAANGMTL